MRVVGIKIYCHYHEWMPPSCVLWLHILLVFVAYLLIMADRASHLHLDWCGTFLDDLIIPQSSSLSSHSNHTLSNLPIPPHHFVLWLSHFVHDGNKQGCRARRGHSANISYFYLTASIFHCCHKALDKSALFISMKIPHFLHTSWKHGI